MNASLKFARTVDTSIAQGYGRATTYTATHGERGRFTLTIAPNESRGWVLLIDDGDVEIERHNVPTLRDGKQLAIERATKLGELAQARAAELALAEVRTLVDPELRHLTYDGSTSLCGGSLRGFAPKHDAPSCEACKLTSDAHALERYGIELPLDLSLKLQALNTQH